MIFPILRSRDPVSTPASSQKFPQTWQLGLEIRKGPWSHYDLIVLTVKNGQINSRSPDPKKLPFSELFLDPFVQVFYSRTCKIRDQKLVPGTSRKIHFTNCRERKQVQNDTARSICGTHIHHHTYTSRTRIFWGPLHNRPFGQLTQYKRIPTRHMLYKHCFLFKEDFNTLEISVYIKRQPWSKRSSLFRFI